MNAESRKICEQVIKGILPPGMTAKELAAIKEDMGYTALHNAALAGKLPDGTTARDLARAKAHNGVTALHEAGAFCHLPAGAPITDLIDAVDNEGKTALDMLLDRKFFGFVEMQKEQVKMVLYATTQNTVKSCAEPQLRTVAERLAKICPGETAQWLAGVLRKRQNIKLQCG